jgi:hypothetical protein
MTLRKKSSDSFRLRLGVPQERLETLLPCPACDGALTLIRESADGRYQTKKCCWCDGTGSVPSYIYKAHRRWLRIYAHNRAVGTCNEK